MIDAELQLSALRSLWRKLMRRTAGGWFWAWGGYGAEWNEDGKYWLFGLGLVTLCAYNGRRGRLWCLSPNID